MAVAPLGYCCVCRARYELARAHRGRLAAAARCRHWRLLAFCDAEQAARLSEHLAAHAWVGGRSVWPAVVDFLAEAHDSDPCSAMLPPAAGSDRRASLRVIDGGGA